MENASCAITCARLLGLAEDAIAHGLRDTFWPGRLQLADAQTLIDCGHNIAGISSLLSALRYYFPKKKLHFLVAMMHDKDHASCLRLLAGAAARVTAVGLDMPRAMEPDALAAEAARACSDVDWLPTLSQALSRPCVPDELRVVCGSVYLAGEALAYFSENPSL